MKRTLIILLLIPVLFFAQRGEEEFLVSQEQLANEILPHPNAANPNPELHTGDAASFTSEANNMTGFSVSNSTVSPIADTSNGYGSFVGRVTASTDGTLRRCWKDITIVVGEIYQVYILERNNDAVDSARYRNSIGSAVDNNNTHAAHTAWILHNYEFTSDNTVFRFDEFVRNTSVTNQYTEFKWSLKLKND